MRLQIAEQANRHHAREQEILSEIESQRGLEAELKQRMDELESAGPRSKLKRPGKLEQQARAQLRHRGGSGQSRTHGLR
jgi:hypothetical protein